MYKLIERSKRNNKHAKIIALRIRDPVKIFYYVRDNIKYVIDTELEDWKYPDETLRRMSGDCDDIAILLKSMYDALGLENGFIITYLPDRGNGHIFNYVRLNGKLYYVDATCKNCKFGEIGSEKQIIVAKMSDTRTIVHKPEIFNMCCNVVVR